MGKNKKKLIVKIAVILFVLATTLVTIFFITRPPNYKLKLYPIDSSSLDIKWNADLSKDFLLEIYSDDLVVFSEWVQQPFFQYVNINNYDKISIKIAGSGMDFSNPETYLFNIPSVLNPKGKTPYTKPAFSWLDNNSATSYFFELKNAEGKILVKQKSETPFIEINKILKEGLYNWRATYVSDNNKGFPGIWNSFEIDVSIDSYNLFGDRKESISPQLDTTLSFPECTIEGSDGALYISDTHANVIRVVKDGNSEIYAGTYIAGYNGDGFRSEVQLNMPGGLAFDNNNNLWFIDAGNQKIRYITPNGDITSAVGLPSWAKSLKFIDNKIYFSYQVDSQVDPPVSFNDFVYTNSNLAYFYIDNPSEVFYYTENETYLYPFDFHIEPEYCFILDKADDSGINNLYVYNNRNKLIITYGVPSATAIYADEKYVYIGMHTSLQKIPRDVFINEGIKGTPFDQIDETETIKYTFANITNISPSLASENIVFITDSDLSRVSILNIATNHITDIVGSSSSYGAITEMEFFENNLYLLDNRAAIIWKYNVSNGKTERFIGNNDQNLATIGADRLATSLFYPSTFTIDSLGNFYIAEQHHILKVNTDGIVELYAGAAGRGDYGYNGEGLLRTETLFRSIYGLYYDNNNNRLLVADTKNNLVRKIENDRVYNLLGSESMMVTGLTTPFANVSLNNPISVTMYNDNVYLSNSWDHSIYRLSSNNVLEPVVGIPNRTGYQGYGAYSEDFIPATKTLLNTPGVIVFDDDIMFFCDTFNNRVRMVENGIIYTVIGGASKGYSLSSSMVLNLPASVAVDENYIYVADTANHLLRRYDKEEYIENAKNNSLETI